MAPNALSIIQPDNAIVTSLLKSAPEALLLQDMNGKVLAYNRQCIELWHLPESNTHATLSDSVFTHIEYQLLDPEPYLVTMQELAVDRERRFRGDLHTRAGLVIEFSSVPLVGPSAEHYGRASYFRNVSAYRLTQDHLGRLVPVERALERYRTALIRTGDEHELFWSCCEAIASVSSYPLAWIGRPIYDRARTVIPIAAAGTALAYVEGLKISWGEKRVGVGPIGMAIRTGITQVRNGRFPEGLTCRWRAKASAAGLRSSISVPVRVHNAVIAVLVVYGGDVSAFDNAEQGIFEEIAALTGDRLSIRRKSYAM